MGWERVRCQWWSAALDQAVSQSSMACFALNISALSLKNACSLIASVPLVSWQFVALKFVSSNIAYDILSLRTSFILPPATPPSIYTILSPVKLIQMYW